MTTTNAVRIYRGEDRDVDFTVDPLEDIEGWALLFTVEGAAESGGYVKLIEKTTVGLASGQYVVALEADDSLAIVPGAYQYDVWRTDSGEQQVLAIGQFFVDDVARFPVP